MELHVETFSPNYMSYLHVAVRKFKIWKYLVLIVISVQQDCRCH
jgi:hypothetical protein